MTKIVNLTQHPATPEQVEAGVFDLQGETLSLLKKLLNFDAPPSEFDLANDAISIAAIADRTGARTAMLGGAPFLMAPLESKLLEFGLDPVYAFSRRESVETVMPDGSVRKTAIFKHIGFVTACQI